MFKDVQKDGDKMPFSLHKTETSDVSISVSTLTIREEISWSIWIYAISALVHYPTKGKVMWTIGKISVCVKMGHSGTCIDERVFSSKWQDTRPFALCSVSVGVTVGNKRHKSLSSNIGIMSCICNICVWVRWPVIEWWVRCKCDPHEERPSHIVFGLPGPGVRVITPGMGSSSPGVSSHRSASFAFSSTFNRQNDFWL